jgi:Pyridoxamine 5'-phosphate oxidase
MRQPREAANLAELYDQDPMPWSRVADALGSESIPPDVPCFLGTVRPDGRPHSAGVGVAQDGEALYFTSGPGTRKARNLNANPACTLSLRLPGIDVVLEGEAHRVTDRGTLARVAAVFRDGGWPAQADGDAITAPYSAQSAGPPPWHLYRFTPRIAFGVGLRAPHGASRWRF